MLIQRRIGTQFFLAKEPAVSAEINEKVEQLVNERVAEELKRAKSQQENVNKQAYGELAKQNIDNDHNSVAMAEDIDNMIQKLQRLLWQQQPRRLHR